MKSERLTRARSWPDTTLIFSEPRGAYHSDDHRFGSSTSEGRHPRHVRVTPDRRDESGHRVASHRPGADIAGPRISLRFDVCSFDDRPPLFDVGLVQEGERLRRLLLPRWNLLAEICKLRAHRRLGEGFHDGGVELGDN